MGLAGGGMSKWRDWIRVISDKNASSMNDIPNLYNDIVGNTVIIYVERRENQNQYGNLTVVRNIRKVAPVDIVQYIEHTDGSVTTKELMQVFNMRLVELMRMITSRKELGFTSAGSWVIRPQGLIEYEI